MRTLFLMALAILSHVQAEAQGRPPVNRDRMTVERAYRIANLLDRQIHRMSPEQEARINRSLDDIVATMRSAAPQGRLICVSRDSDNRDPWMLAYEENPVTLTVYPEAVIGTLAQCNQSLANRRQVDFSRSLVCTSRDKDGKYPWQIGIFDEDSKTLINIPNSAVGDLTNCSQVVADVKLYQDDLAMCVSRDNDGRSPWVLILYKSSGQIEKRNELFNSYQSCVEKL